MIGGDYNMANDNFFESGQEGQDESQEVEKIRLGDKEYSQDELTKLVGLGEMGLEAEQKYKIKLDKVYPNMQRVINEKVQLEQRLKQEDEIKARVQAQTQQPSQTANAQPTQDQIRAEALKQAEMLGIGPDAIRRTVMEVVQGQQLLGDISNVIDTMTGEGLPDTTTDEIIQHMQETGIRNPEKAYKDMFEKEWMANQAEKINSIKSKGMPTLSQSSAGAKVPASVKITTANLEQMVSESLNGSYN